LHIVSYYGISYAVHLSSSFPFIVAKNTPSTTLGNGPQHITKILGENVVSTESIHPHPHQYVVHVLKLIIIITVTVKLTQRKVFFQHTSTIDHCLPQSKHNYSLRSHLLVFVRQSTQLFPVAQLINTHKYKNIHQRLT